jgi:hypothetical protein
VPTFPAPQNPQPPRPDRGDPSGVGGAGKTNAPAIERVRDQLQLFLILLLSFIVVNQLSLPFRLGGFAFSLAMGWVGIRLLIGMSALNRAGIPVRGWPSVIIGLGLAGVMTLILAVQAALYPLTVEHERCLSEANTLRAEAHCEQNYRGRLDRMTDNLRNRPSSQ